MYPYVHCKVVLDCYTVLFYTLCCIILFMMYYFAQCLSTFHLMLLLVFLDGCGGNTVSMLFILDLPHVDTKQNFKLNLKGINDI